jgi:Ca2+-binding EF-hand superfamily protein
MKFFLRSGLLLLVLTFPLLVKAQYDIDSLLNEEVVVENPVYKPVIAIGSGVFNFYGDVMSSKINPVMGNNAYKVNVSTFVDPKRYFRANFNFIYGQLSGDHTFPDTTVNFQTDLVTFGVNLEYGFDHILKKEKLIKPFVSVGLENIQFTPKGDLKDAQGRYYNPWSDGTLRDLPNGKAGSIILNRDYEYETDLRKMRVDSGFSRYNQNAFSVPIDAGIDFKISDRVTCRLGTSIHLTGTDFLDNISSRENLVPGRKGNDFFTFSYFTLHFDLFSQPKTMIIEKMFAELQVDDVMYDDEDGDFVLDRVDNCPGTPYGVAVDTTGCPFDTDKDGIADYLDKEPNSAPGAWVNADGKTVSESDYLASLLSRSDAMSRRDVKAYFETIGKGYVRKAVSDIPEKFKKLDIDKDGYISFEELLQAIDDYFDFKLNFKVEDIYELNNFFFEQQ